MVRSLRRAPLSKDMEELARKLVGCGGEGSGLGGRGGASAKFQALRWGETGGCPGLARWPVWPEPSDGQEGRWASQQATSGRHR